MDECNGNQGKPEFYVPKKGDNGQRSVHTIFYNEGMYKGNGNKDQTTEKYYYVPYFHVGGV